MNNTKLGKLGEDIAAAFLLHQGYMILDRNFYAIGGEIDIVALEGNMSEIVFVEVKCRIVDSWQKLDQTFSWLKYHRMKKVIGKYLEQFENDEESWRIDHIAVKLSTHYQIEELSHFKAVNMEFD